MKKIKFLAALAILVIAFATCVENDPALGVPEEEEGIPEPTPVGTPVDDMVTKEIGPDGGSISSVDDNLKLVIPVGALNTTTSISVQPILNFAPGGIGNAYELSPDGQNFSKPVTITFHYIDSVDGAIWSDFGIAFQDASGFWHRADNIVSDSISKTITATSLHFTGFSLYSGTAITPVYSTVRVSKSVDLELRMVAHREDDDLMFLIPSKGLSVTWMVEGVVNGNATVGTLTTQSNRSLVATYTAPNKAPSPNVVKIKMQARTPRDNFSRTAFVKIRGDEWHFTLEMGEGHGVVSKNYSYDKVFLDIDVVKDVVTISNIRNFPPEPTSVTDATLSCTTTLSGGATGQINIVSATGTVDLEGQLLTLMFTHSGAQLPKLTTKCPDADPVTSGGESFSGSPSSEHFELKEGVQIHGIENDLFWSKLTPR